MRYEAEGVQPILLRVEDVAKLLGIARSTVYALIADGELPVVRIGRVTRVSRHALIGWIEEHTEQDGRRAA
jgi:excisionase family DNA binding protein